MTARGDRPRLPCSADPEFWFSDHSKDQQVAAAACRLGCPVLARCRDLAERFELCSTHTYGTWGGRTASERRALRRAEQLARAS